MNYEKYKLEDKTIEKGTFSLIRTNWETNYYDVFHNVNFQISLSEEVIFEKCTFK